LKLKSDSLDWALKHFEKIGYTNIFPKPFEYYAIKEDWKNIKDYILKINFPTDWIIRESRKIFAPKHQYGFRLCSQLDPIDELIYTSIVYEIGEELEKSRIEKKKEVVFSNRFKPSTIGFFWDSDYNYKKFDDKTLELINSEEYKYIVIADIADFFPRIYTHVLENSLNKATKKKEHVKSLKKLLANLYQNVSYGIPVGSDASFLLAETMLNSIDRRLIDENTTFCRFVDDFRIFCKTKFEAYEKLNLLAEILFNNLSLTLQQHKTEIFNIKTYKKIKYERHEFYDSLSEEMNNFLENTLKIDVYAVINGSIDLSDEIIEQLKQFEFEKIIEEQIKKEKIDITLTKFTLKALIQKNNIKVIDDILDNIENFYPVINDVIGYFLDLKILPSSVKKNIAKKLIDVLNNSYIGHSIYNRMWILNLFANDKDWNGKDGYVNLLKIYKDMFSKRKLMLAMGRSKKDYWFQSERRNFPTAFTSWEKRAFIAAYSCAPQDEKKHWYDSIKRSGNLDLLDKAIINWVKNNPF